MLVKLLLAALLLTLAGCARLQNPGFVVATVTGLGATETVTKPAVPGQVIAFNWLNSLTYRPDGTTAYQVDVGTIILVTLNVDSSATVFRSDVCDDNDLGYPNTVRYTVGYHVELVNQADVVTVLDPTLADRGKLKLTLRLNR